tara:strand:- start:704 stop:1144 length:441 start_codon:yes stop_codon:yes gene_type:complete
MNFDELIVCSRCGSDACYKQEVTKDVSIEMCYGCGFQSNSVMKNGSDFFNEQLEVLPEIYKILMDEEEETGKVWVPTTVNIKEKGMIFAMGTDRNNWSWAAAKAIPTPLEELEKHKGEKFKTDMSNVKHFNERDFMDALSYIEVIP